MLAFWVDPCRRDRIRPVAGRGSSGTPHRVQDQRAGGWLWVPLGANPARLRSRSPSLGDDATCAKPAEFESFGSPGFRHPSHPHCGGQTCKKILMRWFHALIRSDLYPQNFTRLCPGRNGIVTVRPTRLIARLSPAVSSKEFPSPSRSIHIETPITRAGNSRSP